MKELPQRKNNRLKGYDYSQNGAYFLTICVKDSHELLGKIDVGATIGCPPEITLSEHGQLVYEAIQNIGAIYENVQVDKYVIMPNHIHMILVVDGGPRNAHVDDGRAMRAPTISTIMNQFKGYVSKQAGFSFWQKLFHDHIIRDAEDYQNHWNYIDQNPAKWIDDEYYRGCRGGHRPSG